MHRETLPGLSELRERNPSWASSLFRYGQVLQQIGVDCIDESEVLTVADEGNHVNKTKFKARETPKAISALVQGPEYLDLGLWACYTIVKVILVISKKNYPPQTPLKDSRADLQGS